MNENINNTIDIIGIVIFSVIGLVAAFGVIFCSATNHLLTVGFSAIMVAMSAGEIKKRNSQK